ncbi:hypothetical protein [Streptomyces subrutilus]|uniref:Uncharacterized protein n=1 Tax=Streptomyces subrutilus TaxID=36818 RepID=A0A5P2ULE2_9ACTN|nr:hypothetical protein [Streptomyces subrutilus]QEU79229.1 hypothetical protein CP968_13700 [Streptomyces subrutilus]
MVTDEGWDLLAFVKQAENLSGGKVRFTTLPVEGFARNQDGEVNVVDDMKTKRLIAEQIGPKAAETAGAPGTAPSAPDAPGTSPAPSREASPPSSPASSPPSSPPASPVPSGPALQDGGGVPCVD